MRIHLIIPLLMAGILFTACGGEQPDIQLERSQADLGTVINGEKPVVEVAIENTGTRELVIEAVTTSCGCTSADVTPEVIPAGGKATLRVTYDSGAHGPSEVGPIMRQVFIASNDPDEPEIEFRLKAEVTAAKP